MMMMMICITLTRVLFDTLCTINAPDDNEQHVLNNAIHNLG